MKIIGPISALLTLIFGSSFFVPAQNSPGNEKAEIISMLQRHDDALNKHDLDGVLRLYTTKSVLLGTGPGERYQGQGEIRTAYTEFFKDFDKGTLSSNCYWKDGDVTGNAAWAAASCKLSDSLNKKPREYELNVSTTLQKTNGKWQFSVLHFSQLIGDLQKHTDLESGRR